MPIAPALLDGLPDAPGWVVGDRGLSSDGLREQAWTMGARPAIPAKRNEASVRCPDFIYIHRNLAETRSVCGWDRAPLGSAQGVACRGDPL